MDASTINVVNPKLAAGRGEEFSAARLREKEQELLEADAFRFPITHRVEDSLETDEIQMASTREAIPESNKGFQMLQRMGWKGQGLGSKGDGIVEPVGGGAEAGVRLGLGKQEEDDFYTSAENIQRKRLEVEIQAEEDETRTVKRELEAQKQQQIKEDVTNIKRTFYCEVCHKQYSSASEMEVHLSSYDHHHRKRLLELKSDEFERTRKSRDKREKRRQEKEMARLNEQIQMARGRDPADGQAVATILNDDQPPLPSEAPPPPPPEPSAEIHRRDSDAQNSARGAVQFNMGGKNQIKSIPLSLQKNQLLGSLGVGKPAIQKKPGKLKSNVAAFAMDSDDDQ